jgi:hypothetical protein
MVPRRYWRIQMWSNVQPSCAVCTRGMDGRSIINVTSAQESHAAFPQALELSGLCFELLGTPAAFPLRNRPVHIFRRHQRLPVLRSEVNEEVRVEIALQRMRPRVQQPRRFVE